MQVVVWIVFANYAGNALNCRKSMGRGIDAD